MHRSSSDTVLWGAAAFPSRKAVLTARLLPALFVQSLPVLLTGGVGLFLAGVVLEMVQGWAVFLRRSELMTLLPMLLGLKCNLEMTLASRLSTAYHMGFLSSGGFFSSSNRVMYANLGVVQIQALVVSVIASALTILFCVIEGDPPSFADGVVILATGFTTAWIAAVVLAMFTAGILYISAKRSFNPDNISGPLVASLGDLLAILTMAVVAVVIDTLPPSLVFVCVVIFAALVVHWSTQMAALHPATSQVLVDGWQPLLLALSISSTAGALLGSSINRMDGGITVLLPLINGVGGNIAGIFASRTASSLHKREAKDTSLSVELTLLLLVIPTHLVFLLGMRLAMDRERVFTPIFLTIYLGAALAQVALLLLLAERLADRAWKRGQDPDNHVVPYLTALGDALGTFTLVAVSYAA